MTPLQAAILGLVEGITEYLPISSTGHLIITSALLGLDEPAETKRAVDAFTIVIQGGAILAVLGLYWARVLQMLRGLAGRDAVGRRLCGNLIVAFLPAAILGPLLADAIEHYLFHPGPVVAALVIGGVVMIAITPWQRRFFRDSNGADSQGRDSAGDDDGSTIGDGARVFVDMEHLTWRRSLLIGMLQCVAMWPGTSRSMMTIVGGMVAGLRPRQAAEFSFLLGLPTLGGACVYKGAKSVLGDGPNLMETLGFAPLVIGIVVATISAALAVKWLVGYLSRHGVALFGWYRVALGAAYALLVWRGMI